MIDQNATARGLGVTVRPTNGSTEFTPTPPTPPPVVCVYPLNASEAAIQAAGFAGKLTPSEGDTQGARTIPDGTLPGDTFIMANAGLFVGDPGAVFDFTEGRKAVEFEIFTGVFSPESATGTGLLTQISAGLTTGAANPLFFFGNLLFESERAFGLGSSRGTEWAGGLQPPSASAVRVGLLVDSVAGVVRAWVDGVEVTLADDSLPPGLSAVAPYIAIEQRPVDDNGAAGLVQYARLYTSAADFTSPFPAGATDVCGNPVN